MSFEHYDMVQQLLMSLMSYLHIDVLQGQDVSLQEFAFAHVERLSDNVRLC